MRLFSWNGMLADAGHLSRMLVGLAAVVLATSFTFMELGFAGIPLPGGQTAYLVMQLLPVAGAALLLGTLGGAINGLVTGAIMYLHSLVMPLNLHELALITPLSSIVLLGFCGLLSGVLFALSLRKGRTPLRHCLALAVSCAVVAWVFSIAFSANALLQMNHGQAAGLSGAEFAAVFDTSDVSVSERLGESVLQACADTLVLAAFIVLTYLLIERLLRLKDDIGMREAFSLAIIAVVTLAYLVTATFNFVTITLRERDRSEASVRSEVNYLCLQLKGLGERAAAFNGLAQSSGIEPAWMTDSDLAAYRMLSDPVGDLLEGYTMQETGTVAILSDGTILTTDDKRLSIGEKVSDLLGADIADAVERSVQTGELQRIPYEGILASGDDGTDRYGGAQIAYLLAGRQGNYTVMIIEPASMFFKNRPDMMRREAAQSLVLLLVVSAIVWHLLNSMVAKRIDEANETLGHITVGNLDERLAVGGTHEFKTLSAGINQTVDALQGWIAEAEMRMASELAAARAIQESTLPRTFPPFPEINEFDVYASMDPAREVGGDFYDFFLVDGVEGTEARKLGFVVADVSGKGVPASLFMMKAKALIRDNMESGMGLSDSVANANRQLCEGNGADMFVTAWVGVLDYETGHIDFVNAGHNPPLLCQEGTWEWLRKRSGMPLGLFDGLSYKVFSFDCNAGDKLLLYTDGVTEAFNAQEEQYGEERLEAVAKASTSFAPRELLEAVRQDLAAYVGGAEQSDDITILTLEVDSVPHLATFASR